MDDELGIPADQQWLAKEEAEQSLMTMPARNGHHPPCVPENPILEKEAWEAIEAIASIVPSPLS